MTYPIHNECCIANAAKRFGAGSIPLIISDAPFGIREGKLGSQYNRDESLVFEGYVEAPADYGKFCRDWVDQAAYILEPHGSMYLISGWSNYHHLLKAVHDLKLNCINEIIWKFQFGVYTRRKFVSSHYNVLFVSKSPKAKPTFNTNARYADDERDVYGRSRLYGDLQDVWTIPKAFLPGVRKNKNKLPEALVRKMIQYSSKPGDIVCDFFLGNFTTAFVAKKLDRVPAGFELNAEAYNYWMPRLQNWSLTPEEVALACYSMERLEAAGSDEKAQQSVGRRKARRRSNFRGAQTCAKNQAAACVRREAAGCRSQVKKCSTGQRRSAQS